MSGKGMDSVIYYPVTTQEHIASMYLDMLYTNGYSATEFYVYNKDNKSFVIAYIDKDGVVYAGLQCKA